MGELSTYSIETDHMIWLSFKSGQNMRVHVGQLPEYLSPRDLKRVRRGIKLRRDFFRNNFPGTLVVLFAIALGLTTLAVSSGQMLAKLWHNQTPRSDSAGPKELVRNVLPQRPDMAPTQSFSGGPSNLSAVSPVVAKRQVIPARDKRQIQHSLSLRTANAHAAPGQAATQTAPVTLPSPSPSPASSLNPRVAPDHSSIDATSSAPNSPEGTGQVLGELIGPDVPTPNPEPST